MNYYNEILKHYLHHPLMQRIVALKERNFAESEQYDYAPADFEDAIDSYDKVLEIVGGIASETVASNAKSVDEEGTTLNGGRVTYAVGTQQNLQAMRQAGLMGFSLPRRFGGLNFPKTVFAMAGDIVARADIGFQNLWGLQDCAETLCEFGSEEQRERYLPRVCGGETMSMDLTEPDAGSDLQSVMLKATFDEAKNCWRLNGVKRFITNGDSEIHLVLARSEEGSRDGRGLSMFIYDKNSGGVDVRRIENKMGIHGSPTCELVFRNAKAELCGSRKLGLIKYVMALMNGARLGIASQSVGLSQATYEEALAYAGERKQFGKAIIEFPAVYEMLGLMKAKLDASRALLYETARSVDIYKTLEEISGERKLEAEERQEQKYHSRKADAFTPLAKGMGCEFVNQNAYDCIQIHGGSGFMKDYACERLYRDARITSIYEGTTQLQVVAAIRYVTNGTYLNFIHEFEQLPVSPDLEPLKARVQSMTEKYAQAVEAITATANQDWLDFTARRLMEMAAHCILSHLLLQDATRDASLFTQSAQIYVNYGESEVEKHAHYLAHTTPDVLLNYHY